MFAKTVIKQGRALVELDKQLKQEKEINAELRNENEDLLNFKRKVITIMTAKGTGMLTQKFDAIDELVKKELVYDLENEY